MIFDDATTNAMEAATNAEDEFLRITPVKGMDDYAKGPQGFMYFDGFPVSGDHLTKAGAK